MNTESCPSIEISAYAVPEVLQNLESFMNHTNDKIFKFD